VTETIFPPNEYLALPGRAVLGLVAALAVAAVARRAGSLTRSGLAAAAVCGTLGAIGGWDWAFALILYFTAASALARVAGGAAEARTRSIVAKGGERDAIQVFANGGVYSIAAALTIIPGAPRYLAWGAMGALATASADSWATEIGVWLGGRPRSIIHRTYVRTGESGGVTLAGTFGSLAGAAWVALVAAALEFSSGLAIATLIAGFVGAIADSVLGATIQERRWCNECREPTERAVHLCGCATRRVGGIRGLDNDIINLFSTATGFLLGVIIYYFAGKSGYWGAID
jgi:uncharacterized protein (TIGR00297 family)